MKIYYLFLFYINNRGVIERKREEEKESDREKVNLFKQQFFVICMYEEVISVDVGYVFLC